MSPAGTAAVRGPLVVEVTRGSEVESRHELEAVVVDVAGRVVESFGDPTRTVLARSALKPIQASALITTGTADAMGLGDEHLALACASHNGEHGHVDLVDRWLTSQGQSHRELECGAQLPGDRPSADALVLGGMLPDARHNNCSGKHAGFLTLAAHHSLDTRGYIGPDHPVQAIHVTPAIEDFCRIDLTQATPGIDGCGMPVWPIPLTQLAVGWSQLHHRGAGRRLLDAMSAQPFLVAGTGRWCTHLLEQSAGRAVVKTGAEGVYCAVDRVNGYGLAIKARDGAARASEAAVAWFLDRWGAIDHAAPRPLTNWAGTVVGEVRLRTP